MRLLLVLLVLLYVSFVYASDLTCKQLCADKKTCCSAPLDNEYYFKSIECVGGEGKSSSCSNKKYFAESEYFAKGSTITICGLNKESLIVKEGLGKHSSDGTYTDLASSVASMTSSISGAVSSMVSSLGGTDDAYDTDGAFRKKNPAYKGGNGKFKDEPLIIHADEKLGKHSSDGTYTDLASSVASMTSSISGAVSSMVSSLGGTDDAYDTDGAFRKKSPAYKGGNGKFKDEPSKLNSNEKLGKHSSDGTYTDLASSVASMTSSISGAVSSMVSSLGGTDDAYDTDGAFRKKNPAYKGGNGKFKDEPLIIHADEAQNESKNEHVEDIIKGQVYKGGDGGLVQDIIIGKCVKVSTVNSLGLTIKNLDKPVISGSKQICKDLFGSESCESEQHKIISVVQSTINDGFANNDAFDITQKDYEIIIKHGKILRNQCKLKGNCQFNRA
ncbi:hypothetical protein RB653_009924 [Dictyostelium firmibasis]|uniref:Uncharacterized protein n=1 Tax=Dictyostelium firmibasis TaxID=79012 RepID=A0AAN7YP45_9MYCE